MRKYSAEMGIKMIFVTVGSQKFPFNRLLEKLDQLLEKGELKEEVYAQIGVSDYTPRNYDYQRFLDREDFEKYMDQCSMLITHGGSGAVMGAVKKGKKVLAVPRKKCFGEHVDDHQEQLIGQFEELGLISACYDLEYLGQVYREATQKTYRAYCSNTENVIQEIRTFLDGLKK